MTFRLLLVGITSVALGACSTLDALSSNKENPDVAAQSRIISEQQVKVQQMEQTIAELRSENIRLTSTVETLKRSKKKAEAQRASLEKQAEEAALLAAEDVSPPEQLVVPAPPKDPQKIIVAEAEAEPLSPSAVPVESTPRLVEPSFASVEAVFENEASGSNIETTSVLFGVHLASYRKTDEAIMGWRNLQRDNPNLLGLLEPRVEQVVIEGRGEFFRLIAGGFSSEEKALSLCGTLKKKKLYCAVTDFNGKRLEIPAAG